MAKTPMNKSVDELARQKSREESPSGRVPAEIDLPCYDFNRNGTPREIKSHPRSLPVQRPSQSALTDETWRQLRHMEEREARKRIVKVVVALIVFAVLAWAAFHYRRM